MCWVSNSSYVKNNTSYAKFEYAKFDMHDSIKEKRDAGCRIVFTRQNQRWHDRMKQRRASGKFFIITHNVVLLLMALQYQVCTSSLTFANLCFGEVNISNRPGL